MSQSVAIDEALRERIMNLIVGGPKAWAEDEARELYRQVREIEEAKNMPDILKTHYGMVAFNIDPGIANCFYRLAEDYGFHEE